MLPCRQRLSKRDRDHDVDDASGGDDDDHDDHDDDDGDDYDDDNDDEVVDASM